MKRHLQKTGVRKFFGQDLVDLQAEPLKALDTFFAQYGACIVQGCEVEPLENDTFNIASGLVAIEATDPETNMTAIKVMPFGGAEGVALPLYLTAKITIEERVYVDGKVKPVAYDFQAVASGVELQTPFITISAESNNRFVDVLQDDKHSFITATERNKWNAILQTAKDYADSISSTKVEATLRSAKEYTDGEIAGVQNEMEVADATTLRTAKDYADTIVAALVDNTPEALDTLQELATALGNNPNFATDVLQAIGERATMAQVNAALAGKANTSDVNNALAQKADIPKAPWFGINMGNCTLLNHNDSGVLKWQHKNVNGVFIDDIVYHSGNFNPASKVNTTQNLPTGYDLNSLEVTGTYDVLAPANSPISGWAYVDVIRHTQADKWLSQTLYSFNNSSTYHRVATGGGNWSPWVQLYHSGNLPARLAAWGHVSANGQIIRGSGNWYVSQLSEGRYDIRVTVSSLNFHFSVTGLDRLYAAVESYNGNGFIIRLGDDVSPNNGSFSFKFEYF